MLHMEFASDFVSENILRNPREAYLKEANIRANKATPGTNNILTQWVSGLWTFSRDVMSCLGMTYQ